MLDSNNAERSQDQDQEQFGVGKAFLHDACDDMEDFNLLVARVPFKTLWRDLMTQQQRNTATALWEACNYGGRPKPGDLKNMEDKRVYAEWVLRIDHRQQCNKAKKRARL